MFGKLISAIPTPFDKDDYIDTLTLEQFLKSLANSGSDAIVAAGSTGEGTSLSLEERLYLFELCKKLAPKGLKVIGNVGTNNTNQTINLICMADFLDIDGYLCIVPYYVLPTQDGIYEHFKAIAKSTSKPIIIYNCPKRCGVEISFETIIKLHNECSNIVGIKHSSNDLTLIRKIKEKLPEFQVFIGNDEMLVEGIKNGADGVISVASNIIGNEVKLIMEEIFKDELDNDLLMYYKNFVNLLNIETNPISLKYILSKKYINFRNLRLPLTKLSKNKCNTIDKFFELN